MDVTPRELRDIDIREGFRGYHRDDVDELLERAASTIEGLERKVRELGERAEQADAAPAQVRETEDVLHRTLLLAQRAADEAVAEAKAKAEEMVSEADAHARTTIADAQNEARRLAERERDRLQSEVRELGERREALVTDVDALERFETDYRARLRRIIEADLDAISNKAPAAAESRPALHDVEVPTASSAPAAPATPASTAGNPAASSSPSSNPSSNPSTAEPAPWRPSPSPPAASVPPAAPIMPAAREHADDEGPATVEISAVESAEPHERERDADDEPAGAEAATPEIRLDARPAPPIASPAPLAAREPLFPDDAPEPEALDDEAFFASLREAVRDDSPLGPREEDLPERRLFDQDDSRRGLFRRRG